MSSTRHDIWIMDSNDNNQEQFTYNMNVYSYYEWSHDGKKIAFTSPIINGYNIWVLKIYSAPKMNLTANISQPQPYDYVRGITHIIGTANDSYLDEYKIEYISGDYLESDPSSPNDWSLIVNENYNVTDDVLGVWNISILNNGIYTLRLIAKDLAENTREKRIIVNIQNLDTDVVMGFFSSEYYVSQNNPTIISYNLKVNAEVTLTVNDSSGVVKTFLESTVQSPGIYSFNWDGTDLSDGKYSYNIHIEYGSRIVNQKGTLVVDNTLPVLSISEPVNRAFFSGNNLDIVGSVNDDNFTGYMLEYAAGTTPVENDYIIFYTSNQKVDNNFLGNLNISDLDGLYTIRLKTTDFAKNYAEYKIVVNIDNKLPEAEIIYPLENSVLSRQISIRGIAKDTYFKEYRIEIGQGESPATWNLIYTSSISVENNYILQNWESGSYNGIYTIRLSVEDDVGNISYDTIKLIFCNPERDIVL